MSVIGAVLFTVFKLVADTIRLLLPYALWLWAAIFTFNKACLSENLGLRILGCLVMLMLVLLAVLRISINVREKEMLQANPGLRTKEEKWG